MEQFETDRLQQPEEFPKQSKRVLPLISKLAVYLLIIFGLIGITFSFGVISSGETLSRSFGSIGIFEQFRGLVGSSDKKLKGEEDGRINILLIGMGGAGHDGPYLADTQLLVSFLPKEERVSMIAIPRDLLVPIPGHGWRKINNANAFGEVKNPGHGGELATEVLSQVLNIPIHYHARIDFAGFEEAIDAVGGITVNVEHTLEDFKYPIPGMETATTTERYEHLYVPAGEQKMDGELALKYARSRLGVNGEGSDFSRSRRQQQVLLALKEKALSFGTVLNPITVNKLIDTVSENFDTDMQLWEILRLVKLGKDVNQDDIVRWVFDDSPDSVLASTITEEGAFVLITKSGDFSEMQSIVHGIFDPELPQKLRAQRIEIQNGTKINGLAYQSSEYLQSLGYTVILIGNAPTQDYNKTVIYDLGSEGAENKTEEIAELLNAEVATSLPGWLSSTSTEQVSPNADILIILGQDRVNL